MANKIQVKRSAVAAKVPTTGDLDLGEIAINTYDGKMYIKKDDGTASIVQIGAGGGGSGDVVGPASATDNAITRYDGTTGKLIQNSTITLDDNGNIINANSLGFDTTPATVPATVGTMSWDDGDGVPSVLLKGGTSTLQVGTQEYARVYNDSGTTLTIGKVVYISGAQGNRVAVKLARADVEATSFGTIGVVSETIANGAEGFILVSGALYKLNTIGLVAGATVYLSPTTAGAITTTKPQAPDQLVVIGWVERVHATVGSIYVKIDNGYELNELHDVRIISPASGNLLIYDASTSPIGVWKNAFLTAGTAISVSNGAGSITVNNTGVTSLTGTANEVDVSASTGAITLSLPSTINADTTGNAATATSATTATNVAGGTANQIPYQTGAGATSFIVAPTTASTALTWSGSAFTWAAAGGGNTVYDSFTATASQTTFTTSTTYTSGKISVYANGVRMVNGSDVTVTGGTSVVFAIGLAAGTTVDLVYPA